jgi:hypothetical protein
MGVLAAVFTLATLTMTRRIYQTIDSSLRLQFENRGLVADLQAAKAETEALNQALEIRVQERTAELHRSTELLRAEITRNRRLPLRTSKEKNHLTFQQEADKQLKTLVQTSPSRCWLQMEAEDPPCERCMPGLLGGSARSLNDNIFSYLPALRPLLPDTPIGAALASKLSQPAGKGPRNLRLRVAHGLLFCRQSPAWIDNWRLTEAFVLWDASRICAGGNSPN